MFGAILAIISLMVGLTASATLVSAQNATPTGEPPAAHPAHIHSGTCEQLGDIVYPLEDVTGAALEGTPDASPVPVDQAGASNVLARSQSTVDTSIDDLLTEGHAINVHESAENIGTYIACGNIEGEPDEDGSLIVELQELNQSGIQGQAVLTPNDEGTLSVTITLVDAEGATTATPAS
ncbi:MAG TPA: hypothetical protein VGR22_04550 [Thermomicrobiales bacterium]|nr:hypothetical protein [Thermomicrobiales bacterium]